jgi:quercetin dioxygenase-like cupin family protein
VEQYSWDCVPEVEVSSMIRRQAIHTPSLTLARIVFQKGAVVPLHQHVNEQLTTIVSGKLQLEVQGSKVALGPGEVARLPSDVPHAAEALEDTIVIDVFIPPMSQWRL